MRIFMIAAVLIAAMTTTAQANPAVELKADIVILQSDLYNLWNEWTGEWVPEATTAHRNQMEDWYNEASPLLSSAYSNADQAKTAYENYEFYTSMGWHTYAATQYGIYEYHYDLAEDEYVEAALIVIQMEELIDEYRNP